MNQKLKPKPVDPGSKAYREDEGGLHTMKTKRGKTRPNPDPGIS